MDSQYAKRTLHDICKWGGSGDEKEVKKILDEYPSLINEVMLSSTIISSLMLYDVIRVWTFLLVLLF